jgi:electron transfer flavoprotein alpha subunit
VILAVAEHRNGALNRASWEAVAAARAIAETDAAFGPVVAALPGAPGSVLDAVLRELSAARVHEAIAIESPEFEPYTADAYVAGLQAALGRLAPAIVVFPHTYQARDFVPALAARIDRPLLTDVTGVTGTGGQLAFVRPMYQGRLAATVVPEGAAPHLVTVQAGAFPADAAKGEALARVSRLAVGIDGSVIRQQPEPPFRDTRQAVDLSKADRIVAIGRGIREERHVELARELARALHAELGASRPVCDSGWLPMDRQIGSSGQTVAPKLYVALGISGAIQHLVGMKASDVVVAINKDPDAPIFEVADYGVVADLFDVVPEIIHALEP